MKPPCRKAGVDCPRRCPGCQAQCPEYKDFRAWCDSRLAQAKANAESNDAYAQSISNMKKKLQFGKWK